MISKNLFLARLMEDLKRRAWLILVSVLLFVISIPTYVAMNISLISAREELIRAARVNTALYEFANNLYSGNSGLFLFTVVFAIICGIQGFSYLYDRSKVDFYHSKPIKTTTRFFYNLDERNHDIFGSFSDWNTHKSRFFCSKRNSGCKAVFKCMDFCPDVIWIISVHLSSGDSCIDDDRKNWCNNYGNRCISFL